MLGRSRDDLPRKLLARYEKWFENRENRSEKQSETPPENLKPLSCRSKVSRRRFSKKFFAALNLAQTKNKIHGEDLQGWPRQPFLCLGVKIPRIGKRGFRSQKTPTSHQPRKGCSKSKNPHFYTEHHKENHPFLGRWGMIFFDSRPNPSLPDLGDFDPCKLVSL